jgi:hypothetical protein
MEDEMISSRVLAGVSALALILAAAAPTATLARGGFGGGGGGHVGGGGGAHFGGGGGFSGAHMGGGSFGAARFGGGNFAGSRASFAAMPAARVGAVGPAFSGARVAGGSWNGGNWHGGHFRHGRFFPGFAAGVVAGAALGSYAYYDDPYYYGVDPYYAGYYDEGATVVVPVGGGDPSYCAQRYRSWDPASGTYLGLDGLRHPCP